MTTRSEPLRCASSSSAAIAATQTNIGHATFEQRDGDVSVITLEVEVRDRRHLARIVRIIRRMPEALHVSRTIARHPGREKRQPHSK